MTGKHAAKELKRKEIDPREVQVRFAPHVQKTLRSVIDMVGSSDEHLLSSLNTLVSGKADAVKAMQLIKDINDEIETRRKKTGDYLTKNHWDFFASQLYGEGRPFTLAQKQKGREGP